MSNDIVEINGKKYKAGPWQIWNGGENPIPGKQVSWQVRKESRKDAEGAAMVALSDTLVWRHISGDYAIVCYRVMEEVKPDVVEVVRWVSVVKELPENKYKVLHHQSQGFTEEIVAKITYNLVDGTPDPKSIKMTLV